MLMPSKKLSTIVAALVVGILSIYATTLTFTSTNQTANQVSVTLNLQSSGQVQVVMSPGETIPTQINNDAVVGVTLYGTYVPAGANAIVPSPNGNIRVNWQMAGSSPVGIVFDAGVPSGTTVS